MIIKSFELNKIKLEKNPFILFYGKNEGLKKEVKKSLINNRVITANYEEKEIIDNKENFLESIYSKSLFEEEKLIVIKRVTDKLLNIISEIVIKNFKDIVIILEAENLEKNSKIRKYFEKEKNCICIPIYPDNDQTLLKVGFNYLKKEKISISNSNLNLLVSRSHGNRQALIYELEKLAQFSKNGKKITTEILTKLSNLVENHDVSELIDNCLANNKKQAINILLENNFSNEDSVFIIRIFLNKLKRILILSNEYKKNNDLNLTISSAKPPIFWKQKEITKQQILKLSPEQIKEIIYKFNKLEMKIKKNYENSLNLLTDFIFNSFFNKTNN